MSDEVKILPEDSELRIALLQMLADDYARKIIHFTIDEPKSVVDIVKNLDIPMTTAYRRVNDMVDKKILRVKGSVVTDDGKKYFLYQSRIKAIYVVFGTLPLEVQIIENKDMGKSAYW